MPKYKHIQERAAITFSGELDYTESSSLIQAAAHGPSGKGHRMTLEAVSEIIGTGISGQNADLALQHWLADRRARLPARISIGGTDPDAMLGAFLTEYIGMVPQILVCLGGVAGQRLPAALADRCVQYFTALPERLTGQTGINGLLTSAYRSHRLFEEFRDWFPELGRSQTSEFVNDGANLLVHALVGEPFSNEIDMACEQDFATLMRQLPASDPFQPHAFLKQMAKCSALADRRLVLLLESHHIAIDLGYRSS